MRIQTFGEPASLRLPDVRAIGAVPDAGDVFHPRRNYQDGVLVPEDLTPYVEAARKVRCG